MHYLYTFLLNKCFLQKYILYDDNLVTIELSKFKIKITKIIILFNIFIIIP